MQVGLDSAGPGWYLNLDISGARAMITKEEPTQLKVMFIFKDSPAFRKLEVGDKITGANRLSLVITHEFGYQGPMMESGNALEDSQGKLAGKLVIALLRGEQEPQVKLQLPTRFGASFTTYPFACKKSDLLLKESCEWLLKALLPDGSRSCRPPG